MGILVSPQKAVSLNLAQENGVNTSIEANPTFAKYQAIPALHIFQRSPWAKRSDDGNPLIHALKGKNGFSILPFWKAQLMTRAQAILQKNLDFFAEHDYCVPIPSSAPFCAEFASMVAQATSIPLIDPGFLRKSLISEVLHDYEHSPPKIRKSQRKSVVSQINRPSRKVCS